MTIISPMTTGNGAYVIHSLLSKKIENYKLISHNPYWTVIPPTLYLSRARQYDTTLIHTTPNFAHYFRRPKKPMVVTLHNYVLDRYMLDYSSLAQQVYYKMFLKSLTKKAFATADRVTAVSGYIANLIKKDLGYQEKVQVIYNGIDTNLFSPKNKKTVDRKIRVLFSGNLTRRKGAYLLPLIADKIQDGIEILYTSGLRRYTNQPKHENLINIGTFHYKDMPSLYQSADILLFPTVREGFGLAAVEAMACGLPVVATNCSSLPEIIDQGKGGYLCQLENVNEFAAKINSLADSPSLRTQMGQYNRSQTEQRFTLERMVREYKELFSSLLS